MSSRRDVDRRGDRERDPDAPRKQPNNPRASAEAAPTPRPGPVLNEYFVEGQGINRQVLQSEICRFLGPEATSRPAEYEVR